MPILFSFSSLQATDYAMLKGSEVDVASSLLGCKKPRLGEKGREQDACGGRMPRASTEALAQGFGNT